MCRVTGAFQVAEVAPREFVRFIFAAGVLVESDNNVQGVLKLCKEAWLPATAWHLGKTIA